MNAVERSTGVRRAHILAIALTGWALLGAALGQLGGASAGAPLSGPELDTLARARAPGPALLLGRALPLVGTRAAEWRLIPGIGPQTAAALEAAQAQRHADLESVRGIGPHRRRWLGRLARAH